MTTSNSELYTPDQLAVLLGVRVSTVYFWASTGYLPTVKLGKLVRFRKESILLWLEKREKPGRNRRRKVIDLEAR